MTDAPVLALDLATNTGWAFWRPGMVGPRYGLVQLPSKVGEQIERQFLSLRRWMRSFDLTEPLKGGYVVIEAPMHNPRRDSLLDLRRLLGLANEASTTARELGAEPRDTAHATMMVKWVGSGRLPRAEGKAASIASANAMGWTTDDDNVADALGLLFHFTQLHHRSFQVPWNVAGPLFGGNKVRAVG